MDWHSIPDQKQKVTLEFSFGEDGVTGGWVDSTGAALAVAAPVSQMEGADVAIAPLSAFSEWTPFAAAPEQAAPGWFEETLPLAGTETLIDAPNISAIVDLDAAVPLDGLVDQTTGPEIATNGLSTGQVVVLGETSNSTEAPSTAPSTDSPNVILFEFLS